MPCSRAAPDSRRQTRSAPSWLCRPARHIDQDVARGDRQTAAGGAGLERQPAVDPNGAAVDPASELRHRERLVRQPDVPRPAGKEDALPGNSQEASRSVASDVIRSASDRPCNSIFPSSRPVARPERSVPMMPSSVSTSSRTLLSRPLRHRRGRTVPRPTTLEPGTAPVEALDGERAVSQPKTRDVGLRVRQALRASARRARSVTSPAMAFGSGRDAVSFAESSMRPSSASIGARAKRPNSAGTSNDAVPASVAGAAVGWGCDLETRTAATG